MYKNKFIRSKSQLQVVALFFIGLLCGGCSTEKDEQGGNNIKTSFSVSLDNKKYENKEQQVLVPVKGNTYALTIETEPEVSWKIIFGEETPEGFFSLSSTSGQGNANIEMVVSPKPENVNMRKGSIQITNSVNKTVVIYDLQQSEKQLVFPEDLMNQNPEDFLKRDTRYNIYHMIEGPNVAVLYDSKWGNKPESDTQLPLDREKALRYAEDIYTWMIDEAGFTNWTTSEAAKYKMLVFVEYSGEGGAVGFGRPNVGVLIVKQPGIMSVNKYGLPGVLQHEIMHSFQYITHYDGAYNYGWSGPIYEMTSQWSLFHRWADWPDLEYGHFKDFMKGTYKAFMHEDNQYHSPYVLAYWEWKRPRMVSRLWQGNMEADQQDPVQTYKRLNNMSQEEFNDEMFEGVCRFVTWDLSERVKEANAHHIDKHQYKLDRISTTNRYRIAPENAPQNYGYNCIKLKVPAAGTTVTIDFTGLLNVTGYKIKERQHAGWRYGFVALKKNGERVYGEMGKEQEKTLSFTVPEGGVQCLWFVVMGAPTTHWKHIQSKKDTNGNIITDNENNWPWQIALTGTEPIAPEML